MKKLLPLIVLLVAGAIGYRIYTQSGDFLYLGTLEATKVDVPARVATVINSLEVQEGDSVTANQVLVKLSSDEFQLALNTAESDYKRAARLFKMGSMPQENYEHLRQRRDEAELKWSWCMIKSPLNGRVLNKYREAGEWVSPGTRLLTLADLSEVWAMLYVPEPLLSKISLGMEVKGFIGDPKGRAYAGKVTRIGDEAEFTPKNVQTMEERTRLVYGIKVSFNNPDLSLKPGMAIQVNLPH